MQLNLNSFLKKLPFCKLLFYLKLRPLQTLKIFLFSFYFLFFYNRSSLGLGEFGGDSRTMCFDTGKDGTLCACCDGDKFSSGQLQLLVLVSDHRSFCC